MQRKIGLDTESTDRELWLSFPQGLADHGRHECVVWAAHHEHARFDINDPKEPSSLPIKKYVILHISISASTTCVTVKYVML